LKIDWKKWLDGEDYLGDIFEEWAMKLLKPYQIFSSNYSLGLQSFNKELEHNSWFRKKIEEHDGKSFNFNGLRFTDLYIFPI